MAEPSQKAQKIAVALEQPGILGFAQSRRRFNQRAEHGMEIKGRATDDLKHVSGSGLLLEGLSELLSGLVPLAGELVKLVLAIDDRRTGTANSPRYLAALGLGLRKLRFHCCAPAPPGSVMNSRRIMLDLPLQSRSAASSPCHSVTCKLQKRLERRASS